MAEEYTPLSDTMRQLARDFDKSLALQRHRLQLMEAQIDPLTDAAARLDVKAFDEAASKMVAAMDAHLLGANRLAIRTQAEGGGDMTEPLVIRSTRYPSPDGIDDDGKTIALNPCREFPRLLHDGTPVFLTATGNYSTEREPGGCFLGYAEADRFCRVKAVRIADGVRITP